MAETRYQEPTQMQLLSWSSAEIITTIIAFVLYALPVNTATRCLALLCAFMFCGHLFWKAVAWHFALKANALAVLTVIYLLIARPLVFPEPTYVYLIPSQGLTENSAMAPHEEIVRRVFALEKRGPDILHNVSITVRDNHGRNQSRSDFVKTYSEIDPGPVPEGFQPEHFPLEPATPWDENYSVTVVSRESAVTERIIVDCLGASAFFAIRVATLKQPMKALFSCRDKHFGATLPEWNQDHPQDCRSLLPKSPVFEGSLDPRPYVVASPAGMYDLGAPIERENVWTITGRIPACPANTTLPRPLPPMKPPRIIPLDIGDTRTLTEWQKAMIKPTLDSYPRHKILILSQGGPETLQYARQFAQLFDGSHWQLKGPIIVEGTPQMIDTRVFINEEFAQPSPDVVAVQKAMREARVKIASGFQYDSNIEPGVILLWIGVQSPKDTDPDSYLFSLTPSIRSFSEF